MELNGKIKVSQARILTVEKGNADKDVEKPVCAFTVDTGETELKVKALLKNDLAKTVFHHILAGGTTASSVIQSEVSQSLQLRKEVLVTFTGEFRELRPKEMVLDNLSELKFNFEYSVELAPEPAPAPTPARDLTPATPEGITIRDVITAARILDATEQDDLIAVDTMVRPLPAIAPWARR